jgi:hypothetical protein
MMTEQNYGNFYSIGPSNISVMQNSYIGLEKFLLSENYAV